MYSNRVMGIGKLGPLWFEAWARDRKTPRGREKSISQVGVATEDRSVSLFGSEQGSGAVSDTQDLFKWAAVQECLLLSIEIPPTATVLPTGDLVAPDNLLIHLAKHMWILSQKG